MNDPSPGTPHGVNSSRTALHITHGPSQDDLPLVDEAQRIAQLLRLVHLVRGKDDRLPCLLQFPQRLLEENLVTGSKPENGSSSTTRTGS